MIKPPEKAISKVGFAAEKKGFGRFPTARRLPGVISAKFPISWQITRPKKRWPPASALHARDFGRGIFDHGREKKVHRIPRTARPSAVWREGYRAIATDYRGKIRDG